MTVYPQRSCRMRQTLSLVVLTAASLSSSFAFVPSRRHYSNTCLQANKDDKKKPPRFAQTVHNKEKVLRKKSIEELEQIMEKRHGTDLKRWTAQDVDPDDSDEQQVVQTDTSLFRAKPVVDPWNPQKRESEKTTSSSNLFGAQQQHEDDPLIKRVRKNQQRFRPEESMDDRDYYDPEDEGFQITDSKKKRRISVDHMIAPQPAGGRGTNNNNNDAPDDTYFFRPPPTVAPESTETAKPQSEKKERTPSIPLLDGDGNPLFLTIEQAKRTFEASLENNVEASDPSLRETTQTTTWQQVGITSSILLDNLQAMECNNPLPVQDKACPDIVQGNKDVLVGTYTGSGKTLAFLAPLVQQLLLLDSNDNLLKVLIVAPGRELASQIVSVARAVLQDTDIDVLLAIGGTTFSRNLEQIRKRKPAILVGTPGRLAELIVGRPGERRGRLKTSGLRALVLDEFDALLEYKPHRDPTNAIIDTLKRRHGDNLQSILCSATASDMLGSSKLANYLRPGFVQAMADKADVLVTSADGSSKEITRVSRTVIHGVIHVAHRRFALETLRRVLHTEPLPQQILIFVENSRKVKIVVEKLESMGIIAAPLHGGMGSEKVDRADVSKALREGYVGIVVATELAARGLDAPLLTHVINFDLPTDASHYAHRAGRCGRGGRPGVVINFATNPQERNVPKKFADQLGIQMHTVEARNGKLNIVDPYSQDLENL